MTAVSPALWLALLLPAGRVAAQGEVPLLDRSIPQVDEEGVIERQRLWALFQQFTARLQELDPELATRWGMHASDNNLTRIDDDTRRKTAEMLERFLTVLPADVDRTKLAPANQWDYDLFERHLRFQAAELKRFDRRASSPQSYLRMDSVSWVFDKDYAGQLTRGLDAVSRLRVLPVLLGQAPSLLSNPPKVWTEEALLQTDGALEYLDKLQKRAAKLSDLDPSFGETLGPAVADARKAIIEYQNFVKDNLLLRSEGSFAVGEEAFEQRLRLIHGIDSSLWRLRWRAKGALRRARGELKKAAKEADPGKEWREALLEEGKDHPDASGVLIGWQQAAEKVRRAMEAANIAAIPPGPIAIIEMPAFDRPSHPFQWYSPPAPFDDSLGGVIYVALPSADLKPAEAERFLRMSAGRERMQVLSAAYAWPGRQYLELRLKQIQSPIRRAFRSGLIIEGWPLYASQLALDSGLYASDVARLWVLHERMLAAADAVLDIDLHTRGLGFEDAVAYLKDETGLSDASARAEVTRLTEEPTRSIAAIEGFLELTDLRKRCERRYGDKFSEAEFHHRLLSYGALPPSVFAPTMLDAWDEGRP